jgi:hypothetical protein
MVVAAERELCEDVFNDFFRWMYDRLFAVREAVT